MKSHNQRLYERLAPEYVNVKQVKHAYVKGWIDEETMEAHLTSVLSEEE